MMKSCRVLGFKKGAEGAQTAQLGHSTEGPPLNAVAEPPTSIGISETDIFTWVRISETDIFTWGGISETDIFTWVGISETDAVLLRPVRQPLMNGRVQPMVINSKPFLVYYSLL